jgi:methylated-DNA-[protein]-cysteine S-methyltransferase
MKPKRPCLSEYCDWLRSPVGPIYLIFSSSGLAGLSFKRPANIIFRQTKDSEKAKFELEEYFSRSRTEFDIETCFSEGTEFEKKVWETIRQIPFGETRTYKWAAEKIGKPHAFRAVGKALGKNPIPIIYPCHRIIESDGSLGGYSSGTDIKRRLLELEYYSNLSKRQ